MPELRGVERLWFSPDPLARASRAALLPLELAYGGVVALRGKLYDSGVLRTRPASIPAISVGNLTVGGTGKTPVAAWLVHELTRLGSSPAVVLRGYGDDETLVHRLLNSDATVIASADRAAGMERAAAGGCDVAVLDDAFQHRRAARTADVVLVSAERWSERRRLLPAGPWRERLSALARASLVVVTRKSATADAAREVAARLTRAAAGLPLAIVHLAPRDLRSLVRPPAASEREYTPLASDSLPLGALAGRRVLAISAIGDPRAFEKQLSHLGARVTRSPFPDHHHFTPAEIARLSRIATELARAEGGGADLPVVVCTLKDAVKLATRWPAEAPPLLYVSQRAEVESGRDALDALLTRTLAARHRQP
jgi:tetraacyldisaccharide 4'-kinase